MFLKICRALFISFTIFIAVIYIVIGILNSLKLDEKYFLTSSIDFIENNKKIDKIYSFCDKINSKNNINIIEINNEKETEELLNKKEFGNIIYACKTNFSEKLTADFTYFHNVKTLEELAGGKFINSEIDYKDKANLFLDFVNKKGILDYQIQNYSFDKEKLKTNILIEFSNDFPEPNLRDGNTDNDDNKHINCVNCHGSEDMKGKRVTGIFFGDAHFGRGFEYFTREGLKKESDYFEKFYQEDDINNDLEENIHRRLYGFDIVGLNLETAVSSKQECQKSGKAIVLKTLPKYLDLFKKVGFNYFNLANNHSFDCGRSGFNATKKHLGDKKLNYFGNMAGEENILKQEINGIKIAFIGINDTFWNITGAGINYDNLIKKIEKLKQEGYKIIINIHWGAEYKTKNSQRQENIAKRFAKAKVDLVIGHHPHVVQNYLMFYETPVYYSLGNFIFDQPFEETLPGMAVAFEIAEQGIKTYPITFTRDNKRYFIDNFESDFEDVEIIR
ncbi:MAG: CapA family protein [Candidatus Gracilibacteria bacterium]|nr:CapA family protein [Candidatus Gracilibacteria bacterium]